MNKKFTKFLVFVFAIFFSSVAFGFHVEIDATNVTCFEANNGTATAYITEGDGGSYSFKWSNGSTSKTINSLSPGNYHVTATDQFGEESTRSVYISQPSAITLSMSSSYETCDISNDGTAGVIAHGGVKPYTVEWSDPASQDYWVAYNLAAGDYSVTITDANGCFAVGNVTVEPSPEGIWLGTTTTDASCANDCDGTAMVMPMTGVAPYSYEWSGGQSAHTATGLCPGDYTVTVTDANGCTAIDHATIDGPSEIVATTSSSPSGCIGDNSGSASVSANGGNGGFSYSWSNGGSGATIMNLAPGTYTVTVTDANNCSVEKSVTVESSSTSGIGFTISANDVSCNGHCDGDAAVNITSGNAPYSYNWSNGSNSSSVSGLCAGSYTVTVSDADGCPVVKMISIQSPNALELSTSSTDANCGSNDGTASVSVTGGNGGYTYAWPNGQTTNTVTGLSSGSYTVTVSDVNGCTAMANVSVGSIGSTMTSNLASSPTTCSNNSDGAASIQVSGGAIPYSYAWSNGATGANATGLAGGTYSVIVTDANGCSITESVTVDSPSEIVINISTTPAVCGSSNGSASANVSGGTGSYNYLWSNDNSIGSSISNVAAGAYLFSVSDGNLCLANQNFTIGQEDGDVEANATGSDVTCNGGSDGSATITVTSGSGAFTYSWADGTTTPTNSGLSAGNYGWSVMDATGCVATGTVTIGEPSAMQITFVMITDASCGGDNGMAAVEVTGGSAPYTYKWNDLFGQTSYSAMGLAAGEYNVLVTDANGCTANGTVTIGAIDGFTCSALIASNYNGAHIGSIGGSDGSATVITNGGNGSFSYAWSNGATTQQITGISAGTYTVIVTDNVTGCTCESSVTLEDPAKLGNFVWLDMNGNGVQDPGEPGLEGVEVTVTGTSAYGDAINMSMTTNNAGMYMFLLPPGEYKVTFTAPDNHDFTSANAGGDGALDSDAGAGGMTSVVTLGSGEYNPNLDAGFVKNCISIGNFVWFDLDQNGQQDGGEGGVAGFVVNLLNADGTFVETTTTDGSGHYEFPCVASGDYMIQFDPNSLPNGYEFTEQDANVANDESDSDVDANGKTNTFTVNVANGNDLAFDAGIHTNCDNVIFPGTVGHDQMLCPGDTPDLFVTLTEAQGGTGEFEYIWMEKVLDGADIWEPIPGSTNPDYQSPQIFTTTLFRKCVRRAGCVTYLEPPSIEVIVNDTCGSGFVSLSASAMGEATAVSLEWVTGSENGEYAYQVQHSANGIDFTAMELMTGHGITNGYNQYSYMDENPRNGTNFYQIIMNGPNGFKMSSDIIKVVLNQNDEVLGLFPNPANNVFYLDILKDDITEGNIELLDANGRVLKAFNLETGISGPRPFAIPELSAGIYFIKATIDGEVKIMKLRKE